MKLNVINLLLLIIGSISIGDKIGAGYDIPPIESYVAEPAVIENISIWVPAAKCGPFINRSCFPKKNLASSSALPASVDHEKTKACPEYLARILAELTSFYHSHSLPLTIFNGWQWEYSYSLCQYESANYNLPQRGGSWETCWETVLNLSCGSIRLQLLQLESPEKFNVKKTLPTESTIEIKTFSLMRIRDGYPKERRL